MRHSSTYSSCDSSGNAESFFRQFLQPLHFVSYRTDAVGRRSLNIRYRATNLGHGVTRGFMPRLLVKSLKF